MAELVDAQVSGICGGNPVEVQVLFRAPDLISIRLSEEKISILLPLVKHKISFLTFYCISTQ